MDGFLVSPEFVKAAKADHETAKATPTQCLLYKALADKVPELQGQRDQAFGQRDAALANGSALKVLVEGKDIQILELQSNLAKMTVQRDSKPGWGTVALTGLAGVAVGGLALGVWSVVR